MRPLNYPHPWLMAKPDKACVKCIYGTVAGLREYSCLRTQTIKGYSPVTGNVSLKISPCADERAPSGSCRVEGIHWVSK